MVARVRAGFAMRAVAREFRVSLLTVQRWVARSRDRPLARGDFSDLLPGRREAVNRVNARVEQRVLRLRKRLAERSALGEYGADAILRTWPRHGEPEPSRATVNRILARRGVLDGQRRVRRPAPPLGWYLPAVAAGQAELDQFDFVEGLVIRGGQSVEVFNAIGLHSSLVGSFVRSAFTASTVCEQLIKHWQAVGLPAFAQFDNDTRFQGPHQYRDTIGTVIRLCLALHVTPVFAPPRETGFQAAIEAYNGRWQAKVWSRFEHPDMARLRVRSHRYVAADRRKRAARIEAAPARQPFPARWQMPATLPRQGCTIFIRRTDSHGSVSLLGNQFPVDTHWPHRLLRCELDLVASRIRFYALRRRDPTQQPLMKDLPYALHPRYFKN
jgi:hypothetical protein